VSKTSIDQIVSKEIERQSAYLRADKKSELTVKSYSRAVEQMFRITGKAPDKLTPEDMQKVKVCLSKKYSDNAMYAVVAAINQYTGRILNRPELRIRPPRMVTVTKIPLTIDEVQAIRKAASERKTGLRDLALIDVMYYGGLRVAEVTSLTISCLDLDMNRLRVNAGKGKNYDMVNLAPEAVQSLRDYIEHGRITPTRGVPDRLFSCLNGGPLIMSFIRQIVKRIAFEAGIEKNVHPHIFRHSMITHMAEKGVSASFIQAQTRHKSLDMVQRYTHLSQKSVRDAYDSTFGKVTPQIVEPKPPMPVPKPEPAPMYADGGDIRMRILSKYLDGEISDEKLDKLLSLADGQHIHERVTPIVGYQ
jgi:integrase/recombinase XerC